MFKLYFRPAFSVMVLLLFYCLKLSAAADVRGVSGEILDPQGLPVAGAHLKLLNVSGAVIREANSDEKGSFIFGDIDPGEYRLTADHASFVSVTLDVSVGRAQEKQVTLQFAQLVSVPQAITVVASAPSLQVFGRSGQMVGNAEVSGRSLCFGSGARNGLRGTLG